MRSAPERARGWPIWGERLRFMMGGNTAGEKCMVRFHRERSANLPAGVRGASAQLHSHHSVENQCLESFDAFENRIVSDEQGSFRVYRGGSLYCVRRAQIMLSPDLGRSRCNRQVWCDPTQIGKCVEESDELIYMGLIASAIWVDEQFGHRERRSDRFRSRTFDPEEDVVSQRRVADVTFPLVNEEASIQCDQAVALKKRAQPRYFQLSRSFWR